MTPDTFTKEASRLIRETRQCLRQGEFGKPDTLAKQAFARAFIAGMKRFAWWKDGVEMVGTCGTTLAKASKEVLAEAGL